MELTPEAIRQLRAYRWPGNVRELQNIIERAVILARGAQLSFDGMPPLDTDSPTTQLASSPLPDQSATPDGPRTARQFRDLERENILRALEQSRWKVAGAAGAARILGLAPSTLSSRMKSLGIRRPR